MRTIRISLKRQENEYNLHFERSTTNEQRIAAYVRPGTYSTKEEAWKSLQDDIRDVDFERDTVFFNKTQVSGYNGLLDLYQNLG